jgi:hypothetical protein
MDKLVNYSAFKRHIVEIIYTKLGELKHANTDEEEDMINRTIDTLRNSLQVARNYFVSNVPVATTPPLLVDSISRKSARAAAKKVSGRRKEVRSV